MSQDQGASAKADRAATPSEPSQSSVVSGAAGIPCAGTPPPWASDSRCDVRIQTGRKVATANVYGIEWSRKRVNARLIAAAPELYEALAAFVDAWDDVDKPFQPEMPRLTKQAKEALAKARGQ